MPTRLAELAALFLKLGTIGFGGPAVHIATMEEEAVLRRKWLTREHYLDLVGATNLIPGPNSTEVAMHVGYHRAGIIGLVVAGCCFILPAVTVTTALAWAYVKYGALPGVRPFLVGVKPAVLAIIFTAGWRLGRKAVRGWPQGVIAATVAVASFFLPGREVATLLVASVAGLLLIRWSRRDTGGSASKDNSHAGAAIFALTAVGAARTVRAAAPLLATTMASAVAPATLWRLGLFFLKVGAVLYGSGYVLIAYLEGGLVDDYGWLSHEQLLEAVAIGQFTPGPILSTASFVGYVVMSGEGDVAAGIAGAGIASIAIFLPSFFFVAALGPIIPRLRKYPLAGQFMDAVNAASIGLMAAVSVKLCLDVLVDWQSWLIAAMALVLVLRWKVTPAWLVLGGAVAGWLLVPAH